MDELSALRLIFRHGLVHSGEHITIHNQMAVYSVCPETMKIVGPTHEYADVYDYILRDSQHRVAKAVETAEIHAAAPETERITEEQFYGWQREQQSRRAEHAADGLSGREIWLLGPKQADDE